MSEGAGYGGQMMLWRRWVEANSRVWSGMLGGDAEALMDPFGLLRQWSGELRQEKQGPPAGEFLGQWTEATADFWRRYAEYVTLLLGFTPRWVEMTQEATRQMFEGGKLPVDPLDLYTRLYNATNGPLSGMIREVLENETFLADSRRLMQNYAVLETVLGEASERYFGEKLRLSTRSDNKRVAKLVVGLEDKLDRLEEAFEEFEYGHASPATAETVGALEGRVEGLERKLDEGRADLARVEEKLDRVLAALNAGGNGGVGSPGADRSGAGERGEA